MYDVSTCGNTFPSNDMPQIIHFGTEKFTFHATDVYSFIDFVGVVRNFVKRQLCHLDTQISNQQLCCFGIDLLIARMLMTRSSNFILLNL